MSLKLLSKKINNFLSRGKLLDLDPTQKVPPTKVGLLANEVYDGVEFPQQFGFKSYPPKDSEVITAHFGGNRSHATVLNAFNRELMPENLAEGETVLYNKGVAKVYLDENDNITLANATINITLDAETGNVKITTAANIIFDAPLVAMTGDMIISGTINGFPV